MKVSIVVPLYNKAPWVKRSLDSIAAQTFRDFEVIVVDDGSTDGGGQVVESYPDPRFRLVRQPNAGPGAARNRGIAEASGEIVAFLDADDEWLPEFLERNLAALEAAGPEVGVVVCGYYEEPSGISRDRMWRRRGVRPGVFRATPGTSPMKLVHQLAYMNPWATVVRRPVLDRHGGFFGRDRCRYGEDAYLWLKVLLNEAVLFRTEPLVRFHTEASALSKNLKGARPVEPFLLHPEELQTCCPRELRALLRQVLSIRASKTACMLAYWGRWEEAASLLEQHRQDRTPLQPWALTATLAATPAGALFGRAIRKLLRELAEVEAPTRRAPKRLATAPAPERAAETRPRTPAPETGGERPSAHA